MFYLRRAFQLGISTAPHRKQCQRFLSFPRYLDVFEHMQLFPVAVKTSCLDQMALNGQKAWPIASPPPTCDALYHMYWLLVNVTSIFRTHSSAFRFGPRWRGLSKINEGEVKVCAWSVETANPRLLWPCRCRSEVTSQPILPPPHATPVA